MSNKRQQKDDFLVQGSILAVTSILVRVIGLIYRIPMTRILGDEGIGYYGYAFEIYNFCFIISSYGMPMAVSKLVSERTAKKEYGNSMRLLLSSLSVSIVTGGLLSAVVYFGARFISTNFFANAAIQIPLKALAPTILISAVLGVIRGFFQGKGMMVPTAFSQLIEQVINGIVSVFAAYELTRINSSSPDVAAYGAAGGVTGTSLGAFFGLVFIIAILLINMPVLRRQCQRDISKPESKFVLVKIILATVVPVMLSQILVRSNGIIAMTLFNNVLSAKGVAKEVCTSLYGVYEGKYLLLCNTVMGITSAITTASIPSLVREKILHTDNALEKKIEMALKFNLIIAIPSTVALGILGGPIIRLLFGDTDVIISKVMLIGAFNITLYTVSILFTTIIQSTYSMIIPVLITLLSMLIDIPLLYILLRYTNLMLGAVLISDILMPVIVISLSASVIRKKLGIRFELIRSFFVPVVASFIMGIFIIIFYFSFLKLTGKYYIGLLVAVPVGIITFFILEIRLNGVNKRELREFPKGGTLIRLAQKMRIMN